VRRRAYKPDFLLGLCIIAVGRLGSRWSDGPDRTATVSRSATDFFPAFTAAGFARPSRWARTRVDVYNMWPPITPVSSRSSARPTPLLWAGCIRRSSCWWRPHFALMPYIMLAAGGPVQISTFALVFVRDRRHRAADTGRRDRPDMAADRRRISRGLHQSGTRPKTGFSRRDCLAQPWPPRCPPGRSYPGVFVWRSPPYQNPNSPLVMPFALLAAGPVAHRRCRRHHRDGA